METKQKTVQPETAIHKVEIPVRSKIHMELPDFAVMDKAFRERDKSYDGVFWVGVRTTGIFCKPSCPARKPLTHNSSFFASPREAMAAGYRPCLRCKPLELKSAVPEWAQTLIDEVQSGPSGRISDEDLRRRGLEPVTVRRFFRAHFGMSFQAYARAQRLSQAFRDLREGAKLDDTVFETGWDSHSGFREAFARRFGAAPGKIRRESDTDFIRLRWIESPLGSLIAGVSPKGICLLEFSDRRMLDAQLEDVRKRFGMGLAPADHPYLDALETQLNEYFSGARTTFDLPLDVPGTDFQISVWQTLRAIPYGQTESYEGIATKLGKPSAVRAVANANGRNRICIVIPCHRVIGKDGSLTGYAGGMWRKQRLLRLESDSRKGPPDASS